MIVRKDDRKTTINHSGIAWQGLQIGQITCVEFAHPVNVISEFGNVTMIYLKLHLHTSVKRSKLSYGVCLF